MRSLIFGGLPWVTGIKGELEFIIKRRSYVGTVSSRVKSLESLVRPESRDKNPSFGWLYEAFSQ